MTRRSRVWRECRREPLSGLLSTTQTELSGRGRRHKSVIWGQALGPQTCPPETHAVPKSSTDRSAGRVPSRCPSRGTTRRSARCHQNNTRRRISRVLCAPANGRRRPFLWDARCRAPRATDPSGGAKARLVRRSRPGSEPVRGPPHPPLLLGLAPGGVFRAAAVAGGAVRSYRTISPLPPDRWFGAGLAVCFLWHCPWGRPRRALPGTAPSWSPDFPLRVRDHAERPSRRLAEPDVGRAGPLVKARHRPRAEGCSAIGLGHRSFRPILSTANSSSSVPAARHG
jgi:hypothetical protein